jgi:hypothetical protein
VVIAVAIMIVVVVMAVVMVCPTSLMATAVEETESVPTTDILLIDSAGTDEEAAITTDLEKDADATKTVDAVPLLIDE